MLSQKDNFGGKVGERYGIIRSYNYGKDLNVYKAYELEKPRVHYVIKSYKTKDAFERECQTLSLLKDTRNIIQMIDFYLPQAIIVCECALYDMETFLKHQDYGQRQEEKRVIIKDIVSGLSELQKHNIVHTELAPKNIMFFQEKDGYTESWKLIDFDTACLANKECVKIVTNYSAPEVIRANDKGTEIVANFEMDMFSLGLTLYFLETGYHYWNGESEGKEEMVSAKYLSLHDIHDRLACFVIKQLLSKSISSRMTLNQFTQSLYYIGEGKRDVYRKSSANSTNSNASSIFDDKFLDEPTKITECVEYDADHLYGMSEREFQLYQTKLTQKTFQVFLEKYHNEMKESLKEMNNKIDFCTKAVGDLTKKIPEWLVKVKNEKVPRVFVMVPDRKDWKKPATWLFSKPFRLYFVCEHKEQWHVPEQAGYKILEVPQFIKKYGPWINVCLQALTCVARIMTSNIFPQEISNILSTVFSQFDNSDLMQHFQEIIDTVSIGVKTIADEDPSFNPLSKEINVPCQMINAKGLHNLKRFLDTTQSADHFGGLVQCIEEDTQEILWLCEEHRDGYRVKRNESSRECSHSSYPSSNPSKPPNLKIPLSPPVSPEEDDSKFRYSPPNPSRSLVDGSKFHNSSSNPPRSLDDSKFHSSSSSPPRSPRKNGLNRNSLRLSLRMSPPGSPVESIFLPPEGCDSKFQEKNLADPLHPYYALDYVYKILCEVIDNADASGRKHFRKDDIRNIAKKMRELTNDFKTLCLYWSDNTQKIKFINILQNQVHLYIHFLRSIVRYCVVKDDNSVGSMAKQMSFLYSDLFEIKCIIKAGNLFNKHLSKLIVALKESMYSPSKNNTVQAELDSFAKEPNLNININDDSNVISNKALFRWYHIANQTHIDHIGTPLENEIFNTTKRNLGNTLVIGKSLKCLNDPDTFSCIEKEIYLYDEHHLNDNDYIIKFHGYSIYNCKPTLFYDCADYDNLYTYFQTNHDSSGNLLKDWRAKVKLAWEISQGVRHLHDQKIVHLDLRSANILLKYNESENSLIPQISNFMWSRYLIANKTFVNPKRITLPQERRRWHDPDRLLSNEENFESLRQSSDIYSLGLLFWEIACCKAENLPFKDIPVRNLYNHLQAGHQEKLPEIPKEYQRWGRLIKQMWDLKPEDRYEIVTIESSLRKFFKSRSDSTSSVATFSSQRSSMISPRFFNNY